MINKYCVELAIEHAISNKYICIYYRKEVHDGGYTGLEDVPDFYYIETDDRKNALNELYELIKKDRKTPCPHPLNENYGEEEACLGGSIFEFKNGSSEIKISFEYDSASCIELIINDCSTKNLFTEKVINKINKILK